MSVFLRQFIDHKKYILIACLTVLLCGFFFGIYQYQISSPFIKNVFHNLFYLNKEGYQNNYQLYLIQNGLYIFIATYLSTSYLGHAGLLFLLFLKGIQISFSLLFIFHEIKLTILICFIIFIESFIEIVLCLCMSFMYIHISLYVTQVTFFIESNFNYKSMLNYKLNCLILSLILFFGSLVFRLYIIPMF